MKSLTQAELTALLNVAGMFRLMFLCTFNHGLRVSEVLGLTRANLAQYMLDVQRLKGSKRTVQPLLPEERDGLLALAATSTGYLFLPEIANRASARRQFNRLMIRYGALAGIPRHKCHAHVLKHTCGRLGYKGGMGLPEIQTHLGHVSGASSMVYMQATPEEAASAFAAAAGR